MSKITFPNGSTIEVAEESDENLRGIYIPNLNELFEYDEHIPSRSIKSNLTNKNPPKVNNYIEEIRKVYERVIELRALLTEEMMLNFLLTGKNELQIVEQRLEDKVIIRLEKIEEK